MLIFQVSVRMFFPDSFCFYFITRSGTVLLCPAARSFVFVPSHRYVLMYCTLGCCFTYSKGTYTIVVLIIFASHSLTRHVCRSPFLPATHPPSKHVQVERGRGFVLFSSPLLYFIYVFL